jgi:hypothetical protein
MTFDLIVPPTYETALTGYVMGAAKRVGKTDWRLEVYRGEIFPRVYRDGKAQASIAICPPGAVNFWLAFKSSPALQYALTA